MTKLKALLALGLLATGIQASPIFYLVTQGNGTNSGSCPVGPCGSSLGTVDFVNGTYLGFNTVTGLQGGEEIFDIAVNSLGEIYGVSATRLYRISTAGAATFLGLHNSGTLNGLTFLNSTLYGVGTNSTLYTLNTTTGAGTIVGDFTGFASAGDVGFVGNRLFVATSSHQIIEIER